MSYCAAGKFHGYAVTLKLTSPKKVEGLDVFTRMEVTSTGKRPSHAPKSQTWKLGHSKKFFFWKFPA
jgi:hypothetical protein